MLNYPLEVGFKVVTIGTRIRVKDATGQQIAYARKKKFKLKEDVMVYENEDQKNLRLRLKADRVIDFSASYAVTGPRDEPLGAVQRQGMRSIWKSAYGVVDAVGNQIGTIHEENAWVKVLDGFMEAIPFGDALGGMFFNPAYLMDVRGVTAMRIQKERSFLEGKFTVEKRGEISEAEEELLLASVIMMILLERDRG